MDGFFEGSANAACVCSLHHVILLHHVHMKLQAANSSASFGYVPYLRVCQWLWFMFYNMCELKVSSLKTIE